MQPLCVNALLTIVDHELFTRNRLLLFTVIISKKSVSSFVHDSIDGILMQMVMETFFEIGMIFCYQRCFCKGFAKSKEKQPGQACKNADFYNPYGRGFQKIGHYLLINISV